jgi:FAD:protein FMN transferase
MNNKTGKKPFMKGSIAFAIPALIILTALTIVLSRNKNTSIVKSEGSTVLKPSTALCRSYPVMGTWAEVSLYGDRKTADEAMDKIYDAFNEINNICSRFDPESELSRLNASASEKPFKCSSLLWNILIKSKYFYHLSNGSFDITITPLMKLWGFYRKQNKIPSEQEIQKALTYIGLNNVVFNSKEQSIFFKIPGIQIDLGGIAKGYAVDYAYKSIIRYDIKSGVINLGGNIRFFPIPPPGKKYYSAGIRNPFRKTELMDGTLKLLNTSLATSGNYEKFILLNGKRFTHIINPKTGYPVKNMAAVTIVAHSALLCDALSTAVFIGGVKSANKIKEKIPGINILIVKGYHDKLEIVKTVKIGEIWKDINLMPSAEPEP